MYERILVGNGSCAEETGHNVAEETGHEMILASVEVGKHRAFFLDFF